MPTFIRSIAINAPPSVVFAWHASPDALKSLIPPWEPVTIEQAPAALTDGNRAVLIVRAGPFKVRWVALHENYQDRGPLGGSFTDRQLSGPFAAWKHTHAITPDPANPDDLSRSVLTDSIEYQLPLAPISTWVANWFVQRKLARMFEFRHRVTKEACERAR
jgi:ligand-binding SRPBCC domain-containing protein